MPKVKKKNTEENERRSAVKPELDLRIKAVGGLYNNEYVGRVKDALTAIRLLHLIRLTGGHACVFSGFGVLKKGMHKEMSLDAAVKLLMRSRVLSKYSPKQRNELELSFTKD